jgi:glycogen(starch) synthase
MTHVFASEMLKRTSRYPGDVLQNPYDHAAYYAPLKREKTRDVIFVGRLIPQKGVAYLAPFLAKLEQITGPISFTIVGDGPQRKSLEAELSNVSSHVSFAGSLPPEKLSRLLREHKVSIIPSTWEEPFGLVALEAIASGCVPVAFNRGGLPEALGSCGVLVPPRDLDGMVVVVASLLAAPDRRLDVLANRDRHLAPHEPLHVASTLLRMVMNTGPRTNRPWQPR